LSNNSNYAIIDVSKLITVDYINQLSSEKNIEILLSNKRIIMKNILVVLLFISTIINAQTNRNKVWVQGGAYVFKTDFKTNPFAKTLMNNATISPKYFTHGNSNICDSIGNLILLSDGYHIYDTLLNIIDGGDTLVPVELYIDYNGWSLYDQSTIFLPMDNNQYYLITPTVSDSTHAKWFLPNATDAPFDLLWYNKIDMNANAGFGKVVQRKQALLENVRLSKVGMMACRHGNGKDWWLMKPALDTNMIYTFRVTQDSIYLDTLQGFAEPHFGFWDTKGQTMFNQEGTMYASTYRHSSFIFLADFDRCYGVLSNPRAIITPIEKTHNPFDSTELDKFNINEGLAFSPNGRFLYVSSDYNIWQYDLQESDTTLAWHHVAGLDTTWQKFQAYSNMYLGADNKLYIGNRNGLSQQMSVIENPDIKGIGCNFCPRCFRFSEIGTGTPPCMPNYSLGAKVCYPEGLLNPPKEDLNTLEVFPNPSSTIFYIKNKKGKKKELYNSVGELILSTTKEEINVSHFSIGIYYLKCENVVKKVVVE
jgi:hypothetical protein